MSSYDLLLEQSNQEYNSLLEAWNNFYNIFGISEAATELLPIDESDEASGKKLHPVFIVCLYADTAFDRVAQKFVKGQTYWHSAIGFNASLSGLYSFNFNVNKDKAKNLQVNKGKGGLSRESLEQYKTGNEDATIEVNCIFLTDYKYRKLRATLNYYVENKEKTSYDFKNLINSLFGKKTANGVKLNLVCSQFVDTILKSIDVDITGKNSNLVKPDDLKDKSINKKQFKIYEGRCDQYNISKMKEKVEKLAADVNSNYFTKE